MAQENKTLRLLIVDDSQNEAERLVNLFRNAGHATRVQRVTILKDLENALQQPWDLLLAAATSEQLELQTILAQLNDATDLPVIALITSNDSTAITQALAAGAQDAVPLGEDERLILVAQRELHNLSERRARRVAEAALQEAEKRCQLLLQSSADAIAYVHDGMHIHANETYLELFGYSDTEELEGMPLIDLIAQCDQINFKDFLRHYQSGKGEADLTCSGQRLDGSTFTAQIHFSPATYDGEPCIQVAIRVDNDNAELEEKLREVSNQDPVTGLPNRNRFVEIVEETSQALFKQNKPASLAFIRIDRFSSVQAEIGLTDADQLLCLLAKLLRDKVGAEAALARFGDDQFTILWPGISPEQAQEGLTSLLKQVEGHLFEVAGRTVQITLSIGIAGLDKRLRTAQDLIDRAHRCADEVPDGNGVKRYDPAEELAAEAQRGNVLAIVRHALETNNFRLLFQPIISLRGDSHEHYEVLLRLLNPQGEEVPPADFLEAATSAGLAAKIDRWVILRAAKMLNEHHARGHKTRLFLHLTAPSLQDPTLPAWLKTAVKAAHLPPDSLVFQFDETDATTYLKQALVLEQALHQLGCRVALNHFGRAANPSNLLRHLSSDYLKVDGKYAKEIGTPEGLTALSELLASVHEQGKQTIVPFIESASMLASIWQAGASFIQGYYLQGPSPSMDYDFSSDDS